MKYLKPWWSEGGGLLHLTILLSLAGLHLDLDLDLYLVLPPPTLFRDELLLGDCQTNPAYAPSLFPAAGGWGRTDHLHPKGREPDPAAEPEGQLFREVRTLGVPFIPRTRVDAWLVHSVAAGDADGAHGLLGAAAASASSAGGVGTSADSGSQAAPGGGEDPRAAPSSPLEEEEAPTEPTAQVPDARGRASEDNEVLRAMGHSSQQEENEQRVSSAQKEKSLHQKNEDENKIADKPEWEAEKTTESREERHLNGTDTSFSLEDLLQLLSSQSENSLEGISLGDSPLPGGINDVMNSSAHYHVNISQAISHDVNLHEAMLLCPNNTFRRDPVERTSQPREPFLPLNSHTINPEQTLPRANLTGFLPPVDHQLRNLTSQDLYDLNINMFDEINSVSLATESFDPLEVSHLFEQPDSDSGLSLNSSHNSISVIKSNSSVCEGAIGSSSDLESPSHCALEGAVGGYYPEPRKICQVDLRSDSGFHRDLAFQHVLHDHTYHLQPSAPESTSESFSWTGKSHKIRSRYLDDTDRHLSRDERRAEALHIPFSIDEIVHMPVDSFNSMLSRHYLTDLQVSLIRDIRRRGKNKVAAQNCRKRKLDIILNLEDDVCNLKAKKETLKSERAQCKRAINIMKQKLHDLYRDIFSRLRDDEGRPVNPNEYALQFSHDGSVWIIPKELVTSRHKKETQKGKRKSERRN
ncbi:nuclear factor erythroid 2-related factor 3 isoform X7 [Phyllostomus discolor]|uniref:Nuclear factor erythroid 2-related factor 3 n=1 Tax=Phyllostomus discolor TaxID=89673 RepID=A0A6J2MVP2_9CHIR|nr:nuclear factor erythroid 2-related factor 3 isoform X8 [Phyllostomus discolor]XP_035866366.1 nuclear factor erythroid 2-related factor 3 isoform X7 [Phyllostomus discolor]